MNDNFDYSTYDNIEVNEEDNIFEEIDLLDINSNKYIEIEHLELYELTTSIAFELAIRNDTIIQKLKEFYKLKNDLFFTFDVTNKVIAKIHLEQKYIPGDDKINCSILNIIFK